MDNINKNDGNKPANKNRKYTLAGLGLLLIVGIVLAVYFITSRNYVAVVGNEKVSIPEFRFFLQQQKDDMLEKAGINADTPEAETFWNSKIEGEDAIDIAKRKTMESLKELKIQLIKAKENKISLTKEENEGIDNYIQQWVSLVGGGNQAEGEKAFEEMYGIKVSEVKTIYREFSLASKFAQKEMEGVTVSEDEIKSFYDNHPDSFKDGQFRADAEEAVWARHILISIMDESTNQKLPADKVEEAKKKAEDIQIKAKNGEDFASLAIENSQDPGSAQSGGDYVFGKGKMTPEFEKSAFALTPGAVSDVVETEFGYHIIKLEETIPAGQPVSYRCAKEYREYSLGEGHVLSEKYDQKIEEWKKDPKFDVKKNDSVYMSIN